MDNRFKFRAWDGEVNPITNKPTMHYYETMTICDMSLSFFCKTHIECDPDELIFMQCSALPDKHGVEIYEGDICRDSAGHEYIIGFTPIEGFYRAPIKEQHHHCTLKNHRDLTVVGNVYEGV